MEPEETFIQTALRETLEETGVHAKNIRLEKNFLESYHYAFRVDAGTIHKEVVFYLGRVEPSQKVTISTEHLAFGWFDYGRAKKLLYYKNSQRLLFSAHGYLLQLLHHKNRQVTRKISGSKSPAAKFSGVLNPLKK